MCDFPTSTYQSCMKENPRTSGTCPLCFDSPPTKVNYGDADNCGLASCIGQPPFAPCGSDTCAFQGTGPVCDEKFCPYTPTPLIDCKRPDGTRCNAYGVPTCLTEDPLNVNLAAKYKYTDFTKYTFDKSKYLPNSYLPGDGADFMFGYNSKPHPEETGDGPCGSPNCGVSSLDYVLHKLNQPIDTKPTFCVTSDLNKDYSGGFGSSRKPTCPYLSSTANRSLPSCDSSGDTCEIPKCLLGNKNRKSADSNSCKVPDCPFAKKEGCGSPDCKFAKQSPKGCGAPDCKYAQKSNQRSSQFICGDSNKKHKNKDKGDYASFGSCDSGVCPFADMRQSEESSGVSCDNPECPFSKKADEECNDKSCPYAKELVICQDCGGVIIEGVEAELHATNPQPQKCDTTNATFSSTALRTSVELEKVKRLSVKDARKELMKEEIKKSRLKHTEVDANQKKTHKEVLYTYPGTLVGHRDCKKRNKVIPANMGWLWNIKPSVGNPELWRGYKPGAISKTVHKMIRNHRRALGIYDPSDLMRKKKSKTSTRALSDRNKRVIHVKKKDGNYFVTLTPVKDPFHRHDTESPFIDCTPAQFRIVKPERKKRQVVDGNGCICEEDESLGSSDMSELDFNFSPPAALPVKPSRRRKVKTAKDTQYNAHDVKPQHASEPSAEKSTTEEKKKKKKKK